MNNIKSLTQNQPTPRLVFILQFIIATALLMEGIDGSMISTAIPAIAVDLQVEPVQIKLAFVFYFLAMAVTIPISDWCASRFGARNVFCTAIAIFTLASVVCATASTFYTFVAARGLQGIGGAMVFPVGRLIVVRSMPKSEFLRVFSNITIPATIGPIAGPMIGGFLTTYLHWSWLFWINVPIGCVIIVLSIMYVPKLRDEPPPFDLIGFLLSGFGLAALVYGLAAVGDKTLSAFTTTLLIMFGIAMMSVYFWRAKQMEAPTLDIKLFAIKTYRTGIVCGFVTRAMGAGAFLFLLPMMLQVGFGLTPIQSGSITFANAVGFLAIKFFISRILRRFGFRSVLAINTIIGGFCIGVLALFLPSTPYTIMIAVLFGGGLSRCLQYMALDTISYADMPQSAMSRASTAASVSKQLAIAMGIAYTALMLQGVEIIRGSSLANVANFQVTFILVALPATVTVFMILRLSHNAGEEISGYKSVIQKRTSV